MSKIYEIGEIPIILRCAKNYEIGENGVENELHRGYF